MLATAFVVLVCIAGGFAQNTATVDAIRYPGLAAGARVQGDVLISDGKVVSGHPLLREAALRGVVLPNLHAPQSAILFHFVLIGTVQSTRTETIQKGSDAFDRFFLRVFRIPTVKKIVVQECVENPNAPANRIDSTKDPIEIWVYGKKLCPTVNYAGTLKRS